MHLQQQPKKKNRTNLSLGRRQTVDGWIGAGEATVHPVATQSIQSQEDSDAIDEPVASNSSIQSRAYLNQLLLLNQSQALVQDQEKKKQAKRRDSISRKIQSQYFSRSAREAVVDLNQQERSS
ncbi:hypothetical protein F511_20153 [Dorcoceras hygrometricum]|uniref:Uncharacterized protein n=1 Tax=Dorcoceras hygrometricum TaxID=472368 RepID=A0A2Z7AG28_9LAMI|nr:hypothetical protein F511_20153 [Dorcoceras hygrometricum]